MIPDTDLFRVTAADDAYVTAKIVAYRALTQSTSAFCRSDQSEDLVAFAALSQNADPLALGASRSGHSVKESLEIFVKTLTEYCSFLIGTSAPEQASELASSLSIEASKVTSVTTEIEAIFARLLDFAFSFEHELGSLLKDRCEVRLSVDLGSALSAKTLPESGKRIVVLAISPASFSSANYFSLPYILSHEFWCHVTASHIQPATNALPPYIWTGASPNDKWEEGWMDFVQRELLRASLDHLIGGKGSSSLISGAFEKETDAQSSSRWDPSKGLKRSEGADVARLFFKEMRRRYGDAEGWMLSMSLSIAINLVACRFDIKDHFVSCTKRFLDDKSQHLVGLGAKDEDQSLVRRQDHYVEVLKRFLKPTGTANGTKVTAEELLIQVIKGWC